MVHFDCNFIGKYVFVSLKKPFLSELIKSTGIGSCKFILVKPLFLSFIVLVTHVWTSQHRLHDLEVLCFGHVLVNQVLVLNHQIRELTDKREVNLFLLLFKFVQKLFIFTVRFSQSRRNVNFYSVVCFYEHRVFCFKFCILVKNCLDILTLGSEVHTSINHTKLVFLQFDLDFELLNFGLKFGNLQLRCLLLQPPYLDLIPDVTQVNFVLFHFWDKTVIHAQGSRITQAIFSFEARNLASQS